VDRVDKERKKIDFSLMEEKQTKSATEAQSTQRKKDGWKERR
jgi:hypothetical protein